MEIYKGDRNHEEYTKLNILNFYFNWELLNLSLSYFFLFLNTSSDQVKLRVSEHSKLSFFPYTILDVSIFPYFISLLFLAYLTVWNSREFKSCKFVLYLYITASFHFRVVGQASWDSLSWHFLTVLADFPLSFWEFWIMSPWTYFHWGFLSYLYPQLSLFYLEDQIMGENKKKSEAVSAWGILK